MFVLWSHVNWQLRLLRPRRPFVPPFVLLAALLVVSACPTITASPVEDIIAADEWQGHKSQPLTSSDSATTPITVQLPSSDRLATAAPDYAPGQPETEPKYEQHHQRTRGGERVRRRAIFERNGMGSGSSSAGLTDLRKYLNTDCVQYVHHIG